MRVNKINEKSKRAFEIDKMGGVDLTSSPVNVSNGRASYMKNMISEGGTNHKRHGFSAVLQLLDSEDRAMRINGMHIYCGDGGEELIIHAGSSFYREDGTKIESEAVIADSKSQSFFVNGRLYIVGCGGILTYDGEKIASIEPYIPLVFTSADYRFNGLKTIDGVNLLTTKRTAKYDGTVYPEDGIGLFEFDPATDFSKEVLINVKLSTLKNCIYLMEGEAPNPDVDKQYTSIYGIDVSFLITPSLVEENTENGEVMPFTVVTNDFTINGKKPYIFDENATSVDLLTREITVGVSGGCRRFSFSFDPTPIEENALNIEVRYDGGSDNSSQIKGCTFGAIVGDDNNTIRLVVSGNDEAPNMCYISDSFHMEGCAFFPDTNYISVGDSRPVTAFLRLSDASLGIFKEKSFCRYEFEFLSDSQTFVTSLKTSGFKSADGVGCINPYTAVNVNSDSLTFTGENVCGVESSSLNSSVERYLRVRGSRIEKALQKYGKEALKSATACEYQGRYYLFIDGDVYIGDTRYKTYDSGKLDSSFEYEWWVWDNVSARCTAVYKDKLYVGTDSGLVMRENEEYRDVGIVKQTRQGDVIYYSVDSSFIINEEIGIEEGAKVKLTGVYSWLDAPTITAETVDGAEWLTVTTENYAPVRDGRRVRVINDTEGYSADAYIMLLENDELFDRLRLADREGDPFVPGVSIERICLYEDGNAEFDLVEEKGYYFVKDSAGSVVRWEPFEQEPALTIFSVKSVRAVYHTPMLDLGGSVFTKTLFKLAITAGVNDIGYLKIGYETHKNDALVVKGVSAVGFEKLNFNYLTFDLNFAKTYATRVYERNFNYIMLRIEQDENRDCVIERITLIYTINNYITGVR